jgi:phage terminase large subunit-like protein
VSDLDLPSLRGLDINAQRMLLAAEKEQCQRSFANFVREAWPHFDPAPYSHSWHIDAIAEHLEAVTSGDIKKLLINIPPRHMKSSVLLLWQVWTWTLRPLKKPASAFNLLRGPGVQFLCGAYNTTKAQQDGVKPRNLIRTNWFQERWGDDVKISPFVDNREQFNTTKRGHRISVGIPESLGKGGVIRILDDPHKTEDVESPVEIDRVIRNYNETWSTRSNDAVHGAEILVMQRQGSKDLSNHVLDLGGWTHLCIPLEYEPERHLLCVTSLGWEDPRGLNDVTGERLPGVGTLEKDGEWCEELQLRAGEPIWPDKFPTEWCREQERLVGPFAFAGQYQQRPAPRGGGMIKSDMWNLWEKPNFPTFDLIVVSYDGAYTDKTYNDPSAATVWGRFNLPDVHEPQFMLIWAWQERKMMHEVLTLLERTCMSARGTRVLEVDQKLPDGGLRANVLLVEAKANGISVAQEMVRLHGRRKFRTLLCKVKGDKTARLLSVQHLFVGRRRADGTYGPGQVWAPDLASCDKVIEQVSQFPKGEDHLVDTTSQALRWLRDQNAAATAEEAEEAWIERNTYQKPVPQLYPCT